jgi:hypothetical protein
LEFEIRTSEASNFESSRSSDGGVVGVLTRRRRLTREATFVARRESTSTGTRLPYGVTAAAFDFRRTGTRVNASELGFRVRAASGLHCGVLKRKWKRIGEKGKEVRNDESKRIVYVVMSIEIEYVGSI